jgi:hypothetical protein
MMKNYTPKSGIETQSAADDNWRIPRRDPLLQRLRASHGSDELQRDIELPRSKYPARVHFDPRVDCN